MDHLSDLVKKAVSDYETKQAEDAFPELHPLVFDFKSHDHLVLFERSFCRFFPKPLHELNDQSLVCYFDSDKEASETNRLIKSLLQGMNDHLVREPITENWLADYLEGLNLGTDSYAGSLPRPLKTKADFDQFNAHENRRDIRRNERILAYKRLPTSSLDELVYQVLWAFPEKGLQLDKAGMDLKLKHLFEKLANHTQAKIPNIIYPSVELWDATDAIVKKAQALCELSDGDCARALRIRDTFLCANDTPIPMGPHARVEPRLTITETPETQGIQDCVKSFEGQALRLGQPFLYAKQLASPDLVNVDLGLVGSFVEDVIHQFVFSLLMRDAVINTELVMSKLHEFSKTLNSESDVVGFFERIFPKPTEQE